RATSATCSSVSPSITVPRSNSIGQASLPGCSTTAWPPSWNAPSSKLVRVRIDGLKNTRAIDRPLSWSPSGLCLNEAACASSASSCGRDQSWVLRKWRGCITGSLGKRGARNEKAQRGGWAVWRATWNWCVRVLPGRLGGRASARARGHACRHAGGGQDLGGGARGVHQVADLGMRETRGQALFTAVADHHRSDPDADPEPVAGIVRQAGAEFQPLVDVIHVVGDRAAELAFHRHGAAIGSRPAGLLAVAPAQRVTYPADDALQA